MQFLWGVLGGVAPEALRFWKLRDEPITPPRSYWPISAIMFVVSGGLAQALVPSGSAMSAVYIGVATPFLIGTLTSTAQDQFARRRGETITTPSRRNELAPPPLSGSDDAETSTQTDVIEAAGYRVPSIPARIAYYLGTVVR